MDILVCIKKVPDTADAEVILRSDGKGIEEEDLAFGINEWDNYAVEEAIRLKEKEGGKVAVVTIGTGDDEDILRRCLAMGADDAYRIDSSPFYMDDPYSVAKGLSAFAKKHSFDLIMTGVMAGDMSYAMTGPLTAGMLGIPHTTLVTSIDVKDGNISVTRELEGGLEESVRLELPALLTIQTGINEPRYVSIMGIRKVRSKEIPVLRAEELGLSAEEIGEQGAVLELESLERPPEGKEAEMISGSPDEIAEKILEIVKGVV
ncbi:MAG: hypothetical protein B6D63_01915 [Candidatus Latescibacteria bacterium 4484_7]|nr:MAG: hypothetical protein B6D63_01915 [Candidatus Latescibacteria bacterium 4484_7]